MFIKIKIFFRNFLPFYIQVPLKYYYNLISGDLENELKYLQYLICKNDNVIDIGANRGVFTYYFYKIGANVVSFEPNPICNQILIEWSKNNKNIKVEKIALSNQNKIAVLKIPIDSNGILHDASGSINPKINCEYIIEEVKCKTLDSYRFTNISFIKIDVEGHERFIIEGGLVTIKNSKPVLLIEIEQRHNQKNIHDIFDLIINLNYEGFFILGNKLTKISQFSLEKHQTLNNLKIKNNKYVNNFIFLHKDKIESNIYNNFLNILEV